MISQKCQYGLRALFELARRWEKGPVRIADVAEAQAIPPRFLEVILSQMKRAGFVESRRGTAGGYMLARSPGSLTVGEVIRMIDGPLGPVPCVTQGVASDCPLDGSCIFKSMWRKAETALAEVYDGTTFRDLVEEDNRARGSYVPEYAI
jgi:Rrf2 family protein